MISPVRYLFVLDAKAAPSPVKERLGREFKDLDSGVEYDFYEAGDPADILRHVSLYCDLHPDLDTCFVSCGGAAITSAVAAGLMGAGEGKTFAVYDPSGTGMLARNFEGRDFGSIARLLTGEVTPIDMIRVNNAYAAGSCTFGMEDLAAGSGLLQSLSSLLRRSFRSIRITADGIPLDTGTILFLALSNGRFTDTGLCLAPQASITDGKADLCIVRNLSPGRLAKLMPQLSDGSFADDPSFVSDTVLRRVGSLGIESAKDLTLSLDGQPLTGKQFTIKVIPGAVRMRIPSGL